MINSTGYRRENNALRELFGSAGGPGWLLKAGWLQETSHCDWYGVTCSNCNEQNVTKLVLNNNNVRGTLSPAIAVLTALTKL